MNETLLLKFLEGCLGINRITFLDWCEVGLGCLKIKMRRIAGVLCEIGTGTSNESKYAMQGEILTQ